MKNALIIGQTNVGKTLFMINFASFLGLKKIILRVSYKGGKILNKEMSIEYAKRYLSSKDQYKTEHLQSIKLSIPVQKGKKEIKLYDSSGLTDGIHPDMKIRESILQTLSFLEDSEIIIHLIDISYFKSVKKGSISEIDKQLITYGKGKKGYILLANKIDLPESELGIKYLKENFTDTLIIPISALYKKGFEEVKKNVSVII
ncbi:MAG: GTP-binding protein HSR1 [Firmicutes bacterium]|nr:GTP-binding protein HSR1 [Bacillota bacterium]